MVRHPDRRISSAAAPERSRRDPQEPSVVAQLRLPGAPGLFLHSFSTLSYSGEGESSGSVVERASFTCDLPFSFRT